jgi:hypothetical protein
MDRIAKNHQIFFLVVTSADSAHRLSIDYLTTQADWTDHFLGTKTDRSKIVEINALIDTIESRGGLKRG